MQRDGDHSRPGRESPVALSDILEQIANDGTREKISVADLMSAMDQRAIAALIVLFAIPNAVPLPPGASTVLGAPLLFLTAQLALGRKAWLPMAITKRSLERTHFAAVISRIAPTLVRAETLFRPRLTLLVRPPCENLVGILCFLLAVILFLPIPMGNMPPAIAICMFALALLERDGLWVIAGCCMAAVSVALVWGVLFALFESAMFLLGRFLS
jgi:hypothetical protein